jgi:hypothetical protein
MRLRKSTLRRSALVEAAGDARVALLSGLIDHAPLFPPASLDVPAALEEDRRAGESGLAFALGRLVWPASRLHELPESDRRLSVLVDGPFDPRGRRIEAVEGKLGDDLDVLAALADEVYVEVPLDDELDVRLGEVKRRGLRAKVRCASTGSPPTRLGWFVLECRAQGVVFKATAGLHHAVRTEEEHGLLNLLAAVAFCDEDAFDERDPGAFALSGEGFRWRGRTADWHELRYARQVRLHSVGSCNFFEPMEELQALGALVR